MTYKASLLKVLHAKNQSNKELLLSTINQKLRTTEFKAIKPSNECD